MSLEDRETYRDDETAKDHVPKQVLFPGEFWMCSFQLAEVLEDEVCVHDYSRASAGQGEARDESPDLWRQLEDLEVVEIEPRVGNDAEDVGADGGGQDNGGASSREANVRGVVVALERVEGTRALLTLPQAARASRNP